MKISAFVAVLIARFLIDVFLTVAENALIFIIAGNDGSQYSILY